MKVFILAMCLLVGVLALPKVDLSSDEWEAFKNKYGKTYKSKKEELHRQKIYLNNKQFIENHNELLKQGEVSYSLAMNHLGDLRQHEVESTMMGYRMSPRSRNNPVHQKTNSSLPDSVDWRTKNLVTPVKNQGMCGSCWAFSTTGALEGQIAKKTGKLVSLSEQNLVDCSRNQGNHGCSGGLMDKGFTYIKENRGIDTEESYPYEGRDGECRFNKANVGGTDTGFVDVKSGSEDDLKDAVATVGPVSVAIDASLPDFQFYHGGVYSPRHCSSTELDHGVLAVGYGTQNNTGYWLVKNSWGPYWGDHGYIKMIRNGKNTCGIATSASYPTV